MAIYHISASVFPVGDDDADHRAGHTLCGLPVMRSSGVTANNTRFLNEDDLPDHFAKVTMDKIDCEECLLLNLQLQAELTNVNS